MGVEMSDTTSVKSKKKQTTVFTKYYKTSSVIEKRLALMPFGKNCSAISVNKFELIKS